MKNSLLALFILSFSVAALARPLDTSAHAISVRDAWESKLMSLPGVAGLGIAACDPSTGELDVQGDFVHCISIMVDSDQAATVLEQAYPQGSKIDGVFVGIRSTGGPIRAEPRMGAGSVSAQSAVGTSTAWPSDMGPVEYHPAQ